MLMTIIIFVAVLSVLVSVHEWGHFFTARRFGVKAEEFGFGFPPRILGFYKNRLNRWRFVRGTRDWDGLDSEVAEELRPATKATIYSLNWLPIGGFVKIKGENGDSRQSPDSFAAKKIWQRITILAAGVVMNFLLAWILFSAAYLMGSPQTTSDLGKNARVSNQQVVVTAISPNSVAAAAGLQPGDIILKINEQEIKSESDLQNLIGVAAGNKIDLAIDRSGESLLVTVIPLAKDNERATIGINFYSSSLVSYPFWSALREGAVTTIWVVAEIFRALSSLIVSLFKGVSVSDQFAGPIGIANLTGQAADLGLSYLLQFMALLSINLAVINILPFPALDGGRIIFLLLEKISGRPVKKEVENLIHNIGFLLLMVLVVFITYSDILKLF